MPALYARWERLLGRRPKSFLRLGSWIGGDRDGNPHVTADSLRLALGRASQALLADYLQQLNALGAELSLSSELAAVSEPLAELAQRGGDMNPARADEPAEIADALLTIAQRRHDQQTLGVAETLAEAGV